MTTPIRWRTKLLAVAAAGVTGCLAFSGVAPAAAAGPMAPEFGPNVKIFDPGTPVEQSNAYLQGISATPEMSSDRHAVFFLPGTYGSAAGENDPSSARQIVNPQVGYYTSIQGLGRSPGTSWSTGPSTWSRSRTPGSAPARCATSGGLDQGDGRRSSRRLADSGTPTRYVVGLHVLRFV